MSTKDRSRRAGYHAAPRAQLPAPRDTLHLHADLPGAGLGRRRGQADLQDVPDDHRRPPLAPGRLRRAARRHPDRRPRPDAARGRRRLARRPRAPGSSATAPATRTSRPRSAATSRTLRLRVLDRARPRAAARDHAAAAAAVRGPARRRRARGRDDHDGDHAAARDLPPRPPARRGPGQPDVAGSRVPAVEPPPDPVRHRRADRGDARASSTAPRTAPLWATALYAGLRRGELIGAAPRGRRPGDRRDPRRARLGRRARARSRRSRSRAAARCRSPPCCATASTRYLLDAPGERAHLRRRPRRYDRGRAAAEAAGVEPPTLHECRHGYASLMIAAGVNVKALSTFMGHANIGITLDQYGHLLPGAEDEAAGLLDAFLARQLGAATATADCYAPRRRPRCRAASPRCTTSNGLALGRADMAL